MVQQARVELAKRELARRQGSNSSTGSNEDSANSPGNEYQNIIGQTFNVPGAAIASAMLGKGYVQGAAQPSSVPRFSELAAQGASDVASRLPRNMVGPAAFIGSSIGQLAGDAVDPRTYVNPLSLIGLGGATSVGKNTVSSVINTIKPSPSSLISKAEKLTSEILPVKTKELANAIEKGNQSKTITEATKIMTKSKDYNEMVNKFDEAIDKNMSRRNEIIKSDNFNINGSQYTSNLVHEILRQEKLGASPNDILQMKQVLGEEQAFLAKNGGKLDRLSGQAKKEFLQDKTDSLLTGIENGKKIYSNPARAQALNLLRSGLKEAVEGGDKDIARLNATYEGLKSARRIAAEQAAMIQKTAPQGLLQSIINVAKNPRDSAIQSLLKNNRSLPKKTAEIEKLMQRANRP